MGSYLIKPVRDEDFYVIYSTVVDAPTQFGTRAELDAANAVGDPQRFARADEHGTSSFNRWGGWGEGAITVREGFRSDARPANAWCANVQREHLRQFCEAMDDDGFWTVPDGIVTWEFFDEEATR